jgi:hypothetical protein
VLVSAAIGVAAALGLPIVLLVDVALAVMLVEESASVRAGARRRRRDVLRSSRCWRSARVAASSGSV